MDIRKSNFVPVFLLLVFLSACNARTPENSNSSETKVSTPSISASPTRPQQPFTPIPNITNTPEINKGKELIRVNGEGSTLSETFSIDEYRTVRVNWDQNGEGVFKLKVINLDPTMQVTRFGKVTFEFSEGSSSGVEAYTFFPGEYKFEIESTGIWEVWIETSDAVFPNSAGANELVRISGAAPGISDPFTLTDKSIIRVHWNQSGRGVFQLSIIEREHEKIRLDIGPPIIEKVSGSNEGSKEIILIPGVYAIDVQLADGYWEIWAEIVEATENK